jgi:hypothetical protein
MIFILIKTLGVMLFIAGVIGTSITPWWLIAFPIALVLLFGSIYLEG